MLHETETELTINDILSPPRRKEDKNNAASLSEMYINLLIPAGWQQNTIYLANFTKERNSVSE